MRKNAGDIIGVVVRIGSVVVRKTGTKQGLVQFGFVGDVDGFSVVECTLAFYCVEEFIHERCIYNTHNAFASVSQTDGNRKDRNSLCKVGGSIYRVNHPAKVRDHFVQSALFSQYLMVGVSVADLLDDVLFAQFVGDGKQIVRA